MQHTFSKWSVCSFAHYSVKDTARKLEQQHTGGITMTIGLGDIVSFSWKDGYDTGTVCQVHDNGDVDVFRPYTHAEDFSMTGRHKGSLSIICCVGVETVKDINPTRLTLVRKGGPIR
jgi:hypothetical protein